ncbi:hypothetical protein BRL53_04805 [Corynebacterium ulcerans]|uniref:GMC family oxidoreductase N-terminal domain-containing protein n=2 Tax=Corynebacterium ulcerans TaxID=65058 RepID=UPI000C75953E|nr:GMC family oxidoreductase N-terminal domain-containing protein [Corynebacterium ulcerans]PLW00061.1 hypothetical protein BRL53_04805 [Corynebacterium ulcerans]
MEFLDADIIVVGGGTSGGSIVRQVTESRPDLKILVIESGKPVSRSSAPEFETERVISKGFNWEYPYNNGFSSTRTYNTGKILGGSSSINGALAFYPNLTDWQDAGLDQYLHFSSDEDGILMPQSEISYGNWSELDRLDSSFVEWSKSNFEAILLEKGHHFSPQKGNNLFLIGRNIQDNRRVNSFSRISTPSPKLEIRTASHAESISEKGNFVQVITSDRSVLKARKAFLSAGVVGSPALLKRSGLLTPNTGSCIEEVDSFQDHPTFVIWCPVTNLGMKAWNGKWRQVALNAFIGTKTGAMIGLLKGVDPQTIPRALEAGYRQPMVGIACLLHKCTVQGKITAEENSLPKVSWEPGKDSATLDQFIVYLPHLLDIASVLRSKGLVEKPLLWDESFLEKKDLLRKMLSSAIQPGWHGVSTLSLNKTRSNGCLREGLQKISGSSSITVCDASIIPSLPKIPTNFLTSKMSALITKEIVDEI